MRTLDKILWLNDFIDEVVDGWMLTDLERLINDIPHRPSATGNCNFPIALYVFACIEFLGQLTSITPINTHKGGYAQNSIITFIDDYFPTYFKQKLQPYRNDFVDIFRNGLAHNFFAKYAGVSRTESEPLQINKDGMLVLDADCFVAAFKLAIEKLKKDIITDQQLRERMVDRYNTQYQDNRLRFQMVPTFTHISNASLSHPSMTRVTTSSNTMTLNDLLKSTTTMPPPPKDKNGK